MQIKDFQETVVALEKENSELDKQINEERNLVDQTLRRVSISRGFKPKSQDADDEDSSVFDEAFSPPFLGFENPENVVVMDDGGPGTPKRLRESPEIKSNKKKNIHPEIGKYIWMEGLNDREMFLVKSKVNSSSGDFNYNVLNESKKKTKIDLKECNWDYASTSNKTSKVIVRHNSGKS